MHALEEIDAAASPAVEAGKASPAAVDGPRRLWPRVLRTVLLAAFSQYIIISLAVGLSVAATLRYYVAPELVADFEIIARALKPVP